MRKTLVISLLASIYASLVAQVQSGELSYTDRLIQGAARDEIVRVFTPGLYRITWIEPRLLPRMKATEIIAERCYTAQDAKNGVNIALPPAQQNSCTSMTTMVGSDIVFDTDCKSGYQQLRVSDCGGRLCGQYTYSEKANKRIFDNSLFIDKIADRCQ